LAVVSWPARLVTDVGEPTSWTLATLAVGAALALTWRSWVPARLVVLPVVVEAVIVLALKAGVHRSGPPGEIAPRILGYFPSGHTATAFVCTGALATLIALLRPAWRRWLRAAVVGWALLMAASLVWYRYHWLTDVLASLLLGLLILRLLCRPLWAPEAAPTASAGRSGDDPPTQDDALRLREDA
jgi:undecaprenyl-diphosphatase